MVKGEGRGPRFWSELRGCGFGTVCGLLLLLGIAGKGAAAWSQALSLNFTGTTKVGMSSQAVAVTVKAQASGSGAAPVALTAGVSNLDFSISDPGNCGSSPVLTSGQTCTVNVIFTPRYPGVRQGAVVIRSADGTQTLASAPLSGVGQGGLPVLVPGEINTVAGDDEWVYQRDGVLATTANIFLPMGLAVDGVGNLYISDSGNNRVRRVDAATGLISTVAGDGTAGAQGDCGQAVAAELNDPVGLALDGVGNLYIADSGNNVIRRVDAVTQQITTVAGQIGSAGCASDNGAATNTALNSPQGLGLTPGGDLLIANKGDSTVRLLTFADGAMQTIAGTGAAGSGGDNGPAASAQLNSPRAVATRSDGAVAIADFGNQRVRLIDTHGTITTVVGTGQRGFSGDGGDARLATLSGPAAVAFDPAGDLIVADSGNNRVRGVYGSPGTITTLVGNSSEEFAGDAGPASSASLYGPEGLVFDSQGNIWIADMFHNRVREISGSVLAIAYPTMKMGKISSPAAEMLYNAGNDNLALGAPVLNEGALDSSTSTCSSATLQPMVFCTMGVEFAPTETGQNVAGSISWPSDAPNVTPVDELNGEVLSVEPTSVALVANANPGLMGAPVTLTASVSSADAGRTGTVTFSEGGSAWCQAIPLAGDGTANCQIPSLSLGSHTFIANYSGDDDNAASTSQPYTEIIKQQPALALAVSSSPAVVTGNVTLTLTAADQSGTPTGSVVFMDGATALATVPLNSSGIASWSTQTLSVGAHSLLAQYSGDSANVNGTSNTVVEQIIQATTVTVLASSNSDTTVGSPVTLTATVVSSNGPAPTGSVQFTDGAGPGALVLGSAPLNSGGIASLTISMLNPGSHSLVAMYSGDADDATSSSAALPETIEQIATVTSLGADVNPLSAGATLHLTAIVSLAPGATADGSLSGNVTFRDGATVVGTAPVNSTGQATLALSTLTVGPHTILASFDGSTNYATSNSVALNETVQQTAAQITLNSAATTTLVGKPASFSVAVTSGTGVPTGTVTFRDGTALLGTAFLDSRGDASFVTTALAKGTHTITAAYGGDASYLAATSVGLQQTVQLAQPTVVLSGPASAVDAGTPMQFGGTLSTPGVAPTGTLTFLDGASVMGTESVSGAGNLVFSTTRLPIGTHTITVSYSGDASNAAATSAAITVIVQQANSATAVVSSANPLTQGGPLVLTATVTSDSPNPGGSVNFFDGTTPLGSAALGSSGTAAFTAPNLTLGTHALTAVYAGDTNHAGSTSAPLSELVVQSSFATLTSTNNPSASGQNVIFAAGFSGAGTLVPSGVATFKDNGALLAAMPLNGAGAASFSTTALGVGTHTITVSYGGDNNFATAAAQLIQTVVNASTQVTLTAGANPATYAQPLSLTATVASNGGIATGTVTFTDAGTVIGSAQLNPNGIAMLTLSTLAPGMHTIVANYGGDGKASPSVSTPLAVVVKQTTALAVMSSSNPAQTLSPISFTAAVTIPGAAPATGAVSFADGATILGTAQVDGSGHATLTVPQMSAGTHSIVASYAGDGANFASSSAAYTETVQLRPTSTTVTGSSTDASNPQQVTLIAVVKGQGSVPPSGTVSFTSGKLTLGVAQVDATGVATITVIFEQITEQVVASYAGDLSYAASQSVSTSITAGEAPQFTLAVNVPSVTLVTQQHTTINVSVGSVKGFSDTITLGCLGLPTAATCTFNSSQLKLQPDGTASAALVIDTGDPLGAGSGASASVVRRGSSHTLLCAMPIGLLLLLTGRRRRNAARRRLGALLILVFALAVSVGVTGCSGLTTTSTPPGTYMFKVVGTGQGSGATQAQTVTLVVTQ